jgi:hypothetical protein
MKRFLALAFGALLALSPVQAFGAWVITHKDAKVTNNSSTLASSAMTIAAGHVILVTGGLYMAAGTNTINVTDQASDTFTIYPCPETTGDVHVSFIAYTITSGLSSQTVSVSTNAGLNTIFFDIEDVAGGAISSIEDSSARACTGSTSSTTTQTITSGTPGTAGDLFVSTLMQQQPAASGTFTEDAGWNTVPGGGGGTTIKMESASLTNSGTGTETRAPTTNASAYAMNVLALKPLSAPAISQPCTIGTIGAGTC